MVQNSQTARIAGRAVKLGNTPIPAWLVALAVAGTFFGSNLVNDKPFVGIVAGDRALAVVEATSKFASGSTTNTLFLDLASASGAAARGYKTASGVSLMVVLDIVRNPTGASFDCYYGRRNSATGSFAFAINNATGTGTIKRVLSGTVLGPDMGFGCNTTNRITSTTLLKAAGVSLSSSVEN